MLKYRLITAAILIPLAIGLVFFVSPLIFCLVTGLISLWALWEWSGLVPFNKKQHRFYYLIFSYVLMSAVFLIFSPFLLIISFVWWLIAMTLVIAYPRLSDRWGKNVFWCAIMGWLTLIPCWAAINFIHNVPHGAWMLFYLFVLVWGADSAAYFVGRQWGKHKLAPQVSPGKSWEGLWGALISTVIITISTLLLLSLPYVQWLWAIGLALITVMFSVLGDLFESMMKRQANLKDSGALLPGHGGVLDRIDSLTAAAPVFALGALILGRILG